MNVYTSNCKIFHIPSGPLNETDKAIQVGIGYCEDLMVRSKIWLPKSQIEYISDGKTIKVPNWIINQKIPSGQTILEL